MVIVVVAGSSTPGRIATRKGPLFKGATLLLLLADAETLRGFNLDIISIADLWSLSVCYVLCVVVCVCMCWGICVFVCQKVP